MAFSNQTNMKQELIKSINELKCLYKKDDIVNKLQNINSILLCSYLILDDGTKIEPLWVESYFDNKNGFEDPYIHGDDKQQDNQMRLYFHKSGRGGIDIVLSDTKNWYFSVLIKHAWIGQKRNDSCFSQKNIRKRLLCYKTNNKPLKILFNHKYSTDNFLRIGINENKKIPLNEYTALEMASFRILEHYDSEYKTKYRNINDFYRKYYVKLIDQISYN